MIHNFPVVAHAHLLDRPNCERTREGVVGDKEVHNADDGPERLRYNCNYTLWSPRRSAVIEIVSSTDAANA